MSEFWLWFARPFAEFAEFAGSAALLAGLAYWMSGSVHSGGRVKIKKQTTKKEEYPCPVRTIPNPCTADLSPS